jgi:hypothetical protein
VNKDSELGADYLIKQLEERKKHFQVFLGTGKCRDFVDYQFVCGQIRGLEEAYQMIEKIKRDLEEDKEDDFSERDSSKRNRTGSY